MTYDHSGASIRDFSVQRVGLSSVPRADAGLSGVNTTHVDGLEGLSCATVLCDFT